MSSIAEPTSAIRAGEPFAPEHQREIIADFLRDGFVHIPGVLEPDEIAALRAGCELVLNNPDFEDNAYGADCTLVRLFETGPVFEDVLTREPIIGLVEEILGPDCHLIAQNAICNRPGVNVARFHCDDPTFFPFLEQVDLPDHVDLPVFVLVVQIPLTDTTTYEAGPTEYVPGSHRSGRAADVEDLAPMWNGRGPVPVFAEPGDIYLHNGQCWHRGAENRTDERRFLFQMAFGRRFVQQRFFPFVDYQLPPHVLARADERRKRVLGLHPKGAYG